MTTSSLPSQDYTSPVNWLARPIWKRFTPAHLILLAILLLSILLHFANLGGLGDANLYYTAAVKSMLASWKNFFFVAAEPGGSVTVDKPPLGLWIEAAFAALFGVSGFVVSLPNLLAGVLGVPVLYHLVKKQAGELAGLAAAFVMTITPIFVATNRNNTQDGLLVFFLLLAAWAFLNATDNGQLGWLLLGAFIVGLGFNIKMMQAFLPLPALYALYFFAARGSWLRKAFNLSLATVLLVLVSLSWAAAVDMTPADQRPYIGSSADNTVMGLIFGHNTLARLGLRVPAGSSQGGGAPQAGNAPAQGAPSPQGSDSLQVSGSPPGGGSSPLVQETGVAGPLRFFTEPLSKQASWLLPFALISMIVMFFSARFKLPLEAGIHQALLLWGGWLLICLVFFSFISGIFHAYYTIMLAPALGAVVGIGFARFWTWGDDQKWGGLILAGAAALTIGFQAYTILQYGVSLGWILGSGCLLVLGLLALAFQKKLAHLILLAAMAFIPLYWTVMTSANEGDVRLPTAYAGSQQEMSRAPRPPQRPADSGPAAVDQAAALLDYLIQNTQDVEYLVAVPSSQQFGSELVLATGRPVLLMGGFNGGDAVVSAADLAEMVADGRLRYVYYGEAGNAEIRNWLQASCSSVPEFRSVSRGTPGGQGPESQAGTLYLCR